jgi:hypothetical protein
MGPGVDVIYGRTIPYIVLNRTDATSEQIGESYVEQRVGDSEELDSAAFKVDRKFLSKSKYDVAIYSTALEDMAALREFFLRHQTFRQKLIAKLDKGILERQLGQRNMPW